MNLNGELPDDIGKFTELQSLDLSYNEGLSGSLNPQIGNLRKLTELYLVGCSFTGPIPDTIGNLQSLVFLSLNSNNFNGLIPASIGHLTNLYWLDLTGNKLTGSLPVSNGIKPGLDMLTNANHFHLGDNQLSGDIPPGIFNSNMTLIHLRLDRNSLIDKIPSNINNLINLQQMYLHNNELSGLIPNLTGMSHLNYIDLSNNSFDQSEIIPSWFSTLQELRTIKMHNTNLGGQLPAALFRIPQLQTVDLSDNRINGTLDISSNPSSQLQLVDLGNNRIVDFTQRDQYSASIGLNLAGNTICKESNVRETFCSPPRNNTASYSTPYSNNCEPPSCDSGLVSSPDCQCSLPYTGLIVFKAPIFSSEENSTKYMISLQDSLVAFFHKESLPVASVSLKNPKRNENDYLEIKLEIFPSGEQSFNPTEISRLGHSLTNNTFFPPKEFYFIYYFKPKPYNYTIFQEISATKHKSSNAGFIVGLAVGCCVLVVLLVLAGMYTFRRKETVKRASEHSQPFGSLPNGQLIAIKRAQTGSSQGGIEFKNEIELLSRVHHKNVVGLVGFCFDQGEQILVYEYIVNGTLKDSLSGRSGIRLDWTRRLKIALGAAKGLQYLHDHADPPIIHRDIKSDNILLDERLVAKVADFGLSKPLSDADTTHVTTKVKGTMGYVDPEYYLTQQLTEKSDTYSFGVVMLELITAKNPIEKGQYIVRGVKEAMNKSKELYDLHEVLDPTIGLSSQLKGLERFVDLALRCVEQLGYQRPAMSEVVKELESIMELLGLNHVESSSSTLASYEGATKDYNYPYSNDSIFSYSGGCSSPKLLPK
ncbi:hypothetical protein L1987_52565 [Smallanthus sonchifolius]|uniref:Uncharacterized protein n=1 Tax=Smallanthus sonchifolius TaxID=185202 RepID=A0ACB9ETH1_9ASTR|nr:hypothetical protein L1987_52565 [Smallanthus sonchifolius]